MSSQFFRSLAALLERHPRLAMATVVSAVGSTPREAAARMLVRLPGGGCLLDTPGMRELGMAGGEAADALDAVFADVADLAAGCRFTDCDHRSEPGCAVRAAIEAGTLPEARLASHRLLVREARASAARLDARSRAEERRETRRRGAMYREILRAKYGQEKGRW